MTFTIVEMIGYGACLIAIGVGFGFSLGCRFEDAYWVMHDGGTPVHHKGKFYYVKQEK